MGGGGSTEIKIKEDFVILNCTQTSGKYALSIRQVFQRARVHRQNGLSRVTTDHIKGKPHEINLEETAARSCLGHCGTYRLI